jgi:hypothetical protein
VLAGRIRRRTREGAETAHTGCEDQPAGAGRGARGRPRLLRNCRRLERATQIDAERDVVPSFGLFSWGRGRGVSIRVISHCFTLTEVVTLELVGVRRDASVSINDVRRADLLLALLECAPEVLELGDICLRPASDPCLSIQVRLGLGSSLVGLVTYPPLCSILLTTTFIDSSFRSTTKIFALHMSAGHIP